MDVLVRFRMSIEVQIGVFSLENARVAIGVTLCHRVDNGNTTRLPNEAQSTLGLRE